MHIIIYFNNKPLVLCSSVTEEIKRIKEAPGSLFLENSSVNEIDALLAQIQQPSCHGIVLLHNDPEFFLKAFKDHLLLVQAAGGLLHTEANTVLLIYRRGKWDLPKGKLEKGESLEECAVREVQEETGLENIILERPLCLTYHTYYENGALILKESHWYLMKGPEQAVLTPQTEEDIEKCEWVPLNELAPYMEDTHASIVDVLKAGLKELHATKNS